MDILCTPFKKLKLCPYHMQLILFLPFSFLSFFVVVVVIYVVMSYEAGGLCAHAQNLSF